LQWYFSHIAIRAFTVIAHHFYREPVMAQDIRNIILSLDEVLSAFACYQRVTPTFLPNGIIVGCRTTKESVILSLRAQNGDASDRSDVALTGLDVLKPLIRFCIENNIMLPREGRKSLIIESNRIIMHIELDLSAEISEARNPAHRGYVEAAKNQRTVRTTIPA
jgi:hypothetical protein